MAQFLSQWRSVNQARFGPLALWCLLAYPRRPSGGSPECLLSLGWWRTLSTFFLVVLNQRADLLPPNLHIDVKMSANLMQNPMASQSNAPADASKVSLDLHTLTIGYMLKVAIARINHVTSTPNHAPLLPRPTWPWESLQREKCGSTALKNTPNSHWAAEKKGIAAH